MKSVRECSRVCGSLSYAEREHLVSISVLCFVARKTFTFGSKQTTSWDVKKQVTLQIAFVMDEGSWEFPAHDLLFPRTQTGLSWLWLLMCADQSWCDESPSMISSSAVGKNSPNWQKAQFFLCDRRFLVCYVQTRHKPPLRPYHWWSLSGTNCRNLWQMFVILSDSLPLPLKGHAASLKSGRMELRCCHHSHRHHCWSRMGSPPIGNMMFTWRKGQVMLGLGRVSHQQRGMSTREAFQDKTLDKLCVPLAQKVVCCEKWLCFHFAYLCSQIVWSPRKTAI